ncbi:MAG: hypothetical protein PHD40_00675 [Syntrophomonadaceae bacterium]|nr:hypothetical protein [Syntrophomonadaceae bacterium]
MSEVNINPDFFVNQWENYLRQLRIEVENVDLPVTGLRNEIGKLDHYLFEINKYYYNSFHETLFPIYRNTINEEVTRQLQLAHDEETLRRDLLTNLKRYAYLYNQVKNIYSLLRTSQAETHEGLLAITRDRERLGIDLLYALKSIMHSFEKFSLITTQISELLADQEWLKIALSSPDYTSLIELIIDSNFDNPLNQERYNTVLAQLHYNCNLLNDLLKHTVNWGTIKPIIEEIKTETGKLILQLNLRPQQKLYQNHLYRQFLIHIQLLQTYTLSQDESNLLTALKEFSIWSSNLMLVMEKSRYYVDRQGKASLYSSSTLMYLSVEFINQLHELATSTAAELKQTLQNLTEDGQPDFYYFKATITSLLERIMPQLKEAAETRGVEAAVPLAAIITRVNLELSFLKARLELLEDKQLHSTQVLNQYLSTHQMINNYLQLLATIKADLERLLAPRNVSRYWKNYQVRVERIPLEKGQPFPQDYDYLLEPHHYAAQEASDPIIVHEEGDLFIIRADNETLIEMPPLLVKQKGL